MTPWGITALSNTDVGGKGIHVIKDRRSGNMIQFWGPRVTPPFVPHQNYYNIKYVMSLNLHLALSQPG